MNGTFLPTFFNGFFPLRFQSEHCWESLLVPLQDEFYCHFLYTLPQERKTKEMPPYSKAEITVEGEETITLSGQKGPRAISWSKVSHGLNPAHLIFIYKCFYI